MRFLPEIPRRSGRRLLGLWHIAECKDLKLEIKHTGAMGNSGVGIVNVEILALYETRQVDGFNIRKAGVTDYEASARDILQVVLDVRVSLEVFSDDFADMRRQALEIAGFRENVYVKILISTTDRAPGVSHQEGPRTKRNQDRVALSCQALKGHQ
jgi:hypothetical protein